MGYGNLIRDDGGLPIPQTVDVESSQLTPMYSKNGALPITDANLSPDGSYKVHLLGKDGKEITSTELGINVILSDPTVRSEINNGIGWVPGGVGKTLNLLPLTAYTGANVYTPAVYNNGASNMIIVFSGLSSTTLTDVMIQLDLNGTFVDYIAVPISGTGALRIIFAGRDATDAAGKACILPAAFRLNIRNSSATAPATYKVDIQLI